MFFAAFQKTAAFARKKTAAVYALRSCIENIPRVFQEGSLPKFYRDTLI